MGTGPFRVRKRMRRYTCMMAAVQKLTGPIEDWEVRGVPLTAMSRKSRGGATFVRT